LSSSSEFKDGAAFAAPFDLDQRMTFSSGVRVASNSFSFASFSAM